VFQIDRYDNLPGLPMLRDVREAIIGERPSFPRKCCSRLIVPAISKAASATMTAVSPRRGFQGGVQAGAEVAGSGCRHRGIWRTRPAVTLSQVVTEFQSAANMAFSMYGG